MGFWESILETMGGNDQQLFGIEDSSSSSSNDSSSNNDDEE